MKEGSSRENDKSGRKVCQKFVTTYVKQAF